MPTVIGDNPESRVVGLGVGRTGLAGRDTTERFYAHGAAPVLARIEGALEEVATCSKLGLVRTGDTERLKEMQESMAELVKECEKSAGGWGG